MAITLTIYDRRLTNSPDDKIAKRDQMVGETDDRMDQVSSVWNPDRLER
jgi:hypothetical protein